MSNELMKPNTFTSITSHRKQNARLGHIDETMQITKSAMAVYAEICRQGFSDLCNGVNETSFWMEALRARYGDSPMMEAMEAAHQNWVMNSQAFNQSIYDVYGDKLVNIINNIPVEPRDVGFWEEIANRIMAFLFDEKPSSQSLLDEIQILGREAKQRLSNASQAHLKELKTILAEMSG